MTSTPLGSVWPFIDGPPCAHCGRPIAVFEATEVAIGRLPLGPFPSLIVALGLAHRPCEAKAQRERAPAALPHLRGRRPA